jgi:uncharacterized cupredoxin-like copper-binding protein
VAHPPSDIKFFQSVVAAGLEAIHAITDETKKARANQNIELTIAQTEKNAAGILFQGNEREKKEGYDTFWREIKGKNHARANF